MKISLIILTCFLVSLANAELGYDVTKCSIDYLREMVRQSCIRSHRTFRHKRDVGDTQHRFDVDDSGNKDEYAKALIASLVNLPPNANVTYSRKPGTKDRRHVDEKYDYIFHLCCQDLKACEDRVCEHSF